ncbi:hypothetical protein FRC04_009021 [Tulasnella sp. 424]|nr:hypothetical protein FRC04_009021 [Tulasnella sp. 424]
MADPDRTNTKSGSSDAVRAKPLERHARHYETEPEYLIFSVEGYLYRVPVDRLQESAYFRDMLESTNTGIVGEGKSDEHPITLAGLSNFEMENFLDVKKAK